jgi:gliding motility-associated-like protein
LTSELPILSSYLVIDGTTQPLGLPFGVSDAKIQVVTPNFDNCKRGFVMRNADHIEIYGISFAGFINNPPQNAEKWRDAIFMWNVHDVIIGAPGKGNTFFGNFHCIRHEAIPEDDRDPPPAGVGYNIIIQNNYLGKNNTGRANAREGVINAIELFDVSNVKVGGYGTHEDNKFMVFLNAIRLGLKERFAGASGKVDVVGNDFIIGTSQPPLPIPLPHLAIEINDNDVIGPALHYVNVSRNDIKKYSSGIVIGNIIHPFTVVNNRIDCDRTNDQFPFSTAISLASCDSGLIGGRDSVNIIHDAKDNGISLFATKRIMMSENVIYCTAKGIAINAPAYAVPKINDLYITAVGTVVGKTCSKCRVEVFRTNQCAAEFYNGENYQQTITASLTGDFTYTGPIDCFGTSFTVTDLNKATSEFYVTNNFIFDTSAVIIQNSNCGQNNGSIKGIKIFSGVDFYWEDVNGNVVGTDTNLVNLGPGLYRLVGTKQNLGTSCQVIAGYYEIKDVTPVINTNNMVITDPVPECNRPGSITGITVSGGPLSLFVFEWTNQVNVVVGTALNLVNKPAGTYHLKVYLLNDPTCFRTAGPFILTDRPSPKFDLTTMQITDATCGKNNGSITGIKIITPTGAQIFRWKDAAGNTVGNTINLTNVPAGNYRLEYDDASPCPLMTTNAFTILNNGLVTIDEAQKIISPSGCTVIKGSIKNIVVTGANLIEWVNTATGAVITNNIDLQHVPSGNYRLRAFDTNYGCADSTSIIFVPLTPIETLNVQNKNVKDETCTGTNGYIKDITLSPSPVGYTYKWVRNSTDTFATTLNITNLAAGDYQLIAIDSNGCTQTVLTQSLIDHPSPIVDESEVAIKNDECTQILGSIKGIKANGGDAPLNYAWYTSPVNIQVANVIDIAKTGKGNFYFVVTDKNGCKDTSTVLFVDDISPIIAPPKYEDAYAKRNSTAYIRNLNGITGNYQFYNSSLTNVPFETNTTGNFLTPPLAADKDYWVERLVGSCKSTRVKVHVSVIDFSKVYLPNAFTPNNDGLNDVLAIRVYGKIIISGFYIYNRWGQQVFYTNNVNQGWDGNYNGKPLATGTYTWSVKGQDVDGTPINLRGTVTLIR